MTELKERLVAFRKHKIEGILSRSKARWAAEGEKVTKYFCNLEKRHYISKHMYKLDTGDGRILEKTDEMLQETKMFYKNLYTEKTVSNVDLNEYCAVPKLTEEEAQSLEGLITLEEATHALKEMKNGKSPGTDGMTAEFFKVFWRQLGGFVVRSLNEGFHKKQMSITQREGIIICIPKGDKPREHLNNWRPISLLNITYKIGSSCIASRLKTVLPKLIDEDQTGFIQGRYIGDTIRLLYDIIYYLKENELPGLLVSLDFEKAFDSVNWKYMDNVMKIFGFGENICQWIGSFYSNIKSSVIVNGKASSSFSIERGCRQGDPISPYLFILCVEVLACKIRQNKDIKGIKISETENKINQFADDTSVLLEGDQVSFEQLFYVLEEFEAISGLKLNYDKTCNVWLGSKRNCVIRYLPYFGMNWDPSQFKILGLWFTNDLENMAELNYNNNFNEIKKLFNIWIKRSSTPLGRIAILKSLILSKMIHLWLLLPNPPNKIIQELQKMSFNFIWENKRDKIKRSVTVQSMKNGGINVPHIETYIKSLKLMWLKKCCSASYRLKWKQLVLSKYPIDLTLYGPEIFKTIKKTTNPFWIDVFNVYREFYKTIDIKEGPEILMEPLFYNSRFQIGGKTFFFESWTESGVFLVKDLMTENGTFLSLQEFEMKHDVKANALNFWGCVCSIKNYMRKMNIVIENGTTLDINKPYNILITAPKGGKAYYDRLLGQPIIPNACNKWDFFFKKNINWHKVFDATKRISEVKFKWFQIRINHRILVTNSILLKMGIVSSNKCNFCKTEKDSIFHYLWQCNFAQMFWDDFVHVLKDKCENCERLSLNAILVLFGTDNKTKTDEGFSYILLSAKFFIYKCRLHKTMPNIRNFLKELRHIYTIDQYASKITLNNHQFVNKWASYTNLLDL